MATKISSSFKEALESTVRETYEVMMLVEADRIAKIARGQLEDAIQDMKKEVKRKAAEFAIEMLQEANVSGIIVQIKL